MPNASYAQFSFTSGEWGPSYQGRMDDPEYKHGLALCMNYVPNQEGSLTPRGGLKRCGNTKHNGAARLLPWRPSLMYPYLSEFTSNNLRLWANGLPVLSPQYANLVSVSGNPPTFTVKDPRTASNSVPPEWSNGDSILVSTTTLAGVTNAGHLLQREFTLTVVSQSSGTLQLSDAETGAPLSAAITGLSASDLVFSRILDLKTVYDFQDGVRQVQFTSQTVSLAEQAGNISISPPDNRVTYLYPLAIPYSLSPTEGTNANMHNSILPAYGITGGLKAEAFIDGPYLDSNGTTVPVAVSGTTGSITLTIHGYDAGIHYMAGDCVVMYISNVAYYFISLVNNNKGNAPNTSSSPYINAHWAYLNVQDNEWLSSTTYSGIGTLVTVSPANHGNPTGSTFPNGASSVWYSLIASNNNHYPPSNPTDWSATPPTWGAGTTYVQGSWVTLSGTVYFCFGTPTVGTSPSTDTSNWVVDPGVAASIYNITNNQNGWSVAPIFYVDDAGGSNSEIGINYSMNNPGRLIRLKAGPQPWNNKATYAVNDLVNFNDVIYKALTGSNIGNQPDTDETDWQIQATTIQWTWGQVTFAGNHYLQCTINLLGADLPNTSAVWEFRMGVFSDTTGWPTCGVYHEGRLWLAGSAANRLDGGCSDQGFNFAPTAPDGTAADSNGVAVVLNAAENEAIVALGSITEGVIVLTSEAEWLLSASTLNDPITPTSAQARRTTAWSAYPNEVTRLPTGLASLQRGGRRVLEYRQFIDMNAYQSRLNTSDMTRKCQHLTSSGIGVTAYQSLSQPVLWCCPSPYLIADFTGSVANAPYCPVTIKVPYITPSVTRTGSTLFGIGYARTPDISYDAPFSFEHGLTYATGTQQAVKSIAVQRGPLETSEYLYIATTDNSGNNHIEMMMPFFEQVPLQDTLSGPKTVAQYGTLSSAFMLDAGRCPAGVAIAAGQGSVDFYGLHDLAGETVSFTLRGIYVGDVTIDSNGHVNVPFNSAFTPNDIYLACRQSFNYNALPSGNGDGPGPGWYLLGNNYQPVIFSDPDNSYQNSYVNFLGQFGYKFRRRGQMLRPQVGTQNGPNFSKIDRNARMGVYIGAGQEVSIGSTFGALRELQLTKNPAQNADVTPLGPKDFTTGIFRDSVDSDFDFNSQLCWEQTNPVPGMILAVGGFNDPADV